MARQCGRGRRRCCGAAPCLLQPARWQGDRGSSRLLLLNCLWLRAGWLCGLPIVPQSRVYRKLQGPQAGVCCVQQVVDVGFWRLAWALLPPVGSHLAPPSCSQAWQGTAVSEPDSLLPSQ